LNEFIFENNDKNELAQCFYETFNKKTKDGDNPKKDVRNALDSMKRYNLYMHISNLDALISLKMEEIDEFFKKVHQF